MIKATEETKENKLLQDELFEVSLTLDLIADTLEMFVSLFHGNNEHMPNDEIIGNALYGVSRTITNTSKELERISREHKEKGKATA